MGFEICLRFGAWDLELPAAGRVQMHLAGGFHDERAGMYIDSHSHPIPEPVWALYRHALELGRGKVNAVFVERDQNFPDESGWREEIRMVRRIAEEVAAVQAKFQAPMPETRNRTPHPF